MSLKNGKVLNRNRCSLDIVREVLSIVSRARNIRKTRIMYGANLSFVQVGKYLKALLGSGLLDYANSDYLITEQGKEFLQLYQEYAERSAQLRQEIERNERDKLRLENMCFKNKTEANKTGIGEYDL